MIAIVAVLSLLWVIALVAAVWAIGPETDAAVRQVQDE